VVDLSCHLDPPAGHAWNRYTQLHAQGRRREALSVLEEFVAEVREYTSDRRTRLVEALCQQTVDVGRIDLLREPLLTELLFPELRAGREARRPPYAKRIAKLADRIVGLPRGLATLGLQELRVDQLLDEALELEPGDAEVLDLQIRWYEHALEYCTHELPSGILEEPEGFRQLIEGFERALISSGRSAAFAEQLAKWRFHCDAWEDYRARRNEYVDYPDYLLKNRRATDAGKTHE
jgi:hypothetical protein